MQLMYFSRQAQACTTAVLGGLCALPGMFSVLPSSLPAQALRLPVLCLLLLAAMPALVFQEILTL